MTWAIGARAPDARLPGGHAPRGWSARARDRRVAQPATEERGSVFGGLLAREQRHPHEFRERRRAHLVHDVRAMSLDRTRAQAELGRDLLVGLSVDQQVHDLALAPRQHRQPGQDVGALLARAPRAAIDLERAMDPVEQGLVAEGLLQEVERTCLHRAHGHRNVGVAGHDDGGDRDAAARQLLLQLETAHPSHPNVEHEAAGALRLIRRQEVARRPERLDRKAHRLDEPAQRVAHRSVVVEYEYGAGVACGHAADPKASRRGGLEMPPRRLRTAAARPPARSTRRGATPLVAAPEAQGAEAGWRTEAVA